MRKERVKNAFVCMPVTYREETEQEYFEWGTIERGRLVLNLGNGLSWWTPWLTVGNTDLKIREKESRQYGFKNLQYGDWEMLVSWHSLCMQEAQVQP